MPSVVLAQRFVLRIMEVKLQQKKNDPANGAFLVLGFRRHIFYDY